MKNFPYTLITFMVTAGGLWFSSRLPQDQWQKAASSDRCPGSTAALSFAAPHPNAPTEARSADNFTPAQLLENLNRAIRNYGDALGGNPVGTSPEIARQLNGENPKHIHFIPPESGLRLNAHGELVDAWGTPYSFQQLSAHQMEIHSAGPDKIMGTDDDQISK
jgi:hypothetical protein